MNLLFKQMEDCCFVDKQTYKDSYGSVKTTWADGASFEAYFRFDNSTAAKVADKESGITNITIITPADIVLHVNDVVKRKSDDGIFRVVEDSYDYVVPKSASKGMQVKKAGAEKWKLPNSAREEQS